MASVPALGLVMPSLSVGLVASSDVSILFVTVNTSTTSLASSSTASAISATFFCLTPQIFLRRIPALMVRDATATAYVGEPSNSSHSSETVADTWRGALGVFGGFLVAFLEEGLEATTVPSSSAAILSPLVFFLGAAFFFTSLSLLVSLAATAGFSVDLLAPFFLLEAACFWALSAVDNAFVIFADDALISPLDSMALLAGGFGSSSVADVLLAPFLATAEAACCCWAAAGEAFVIFADDDLIPLLDFLTAVFFVFLAEGSALRKNECNVAEGFFPTTTFSFLSFFLVALSSPGVATAAPPEALEGFLLGGVRGVTAVLFFFWGMGLT
mmetsp:Transcript_10824/g.19635  ORF Transcript_10824/g.19635 Transcript_10824/m.19635 type:complete len:328 (+) Transcript_10824:4089-5072(+)